YLAGLRARGLTVFKIKGDGNCLFGAVSHQVYGTPVHHDIVRNACVSYMQENEERFAAFEDGSGGFVARATLMRQNGVWGDNMELQALCDMKFEPQVVVLTTQLLAPGLKAAL
ncbi:hypothetical protein JKP88DRAFT_155195, partial [Tribonema minus]